MYYIFLQKSFDHHSVLYEEAKSVCTQKILDLTIIEHCIIEHCIIEIIIEIKVFCFSTANKKSVLEHL